MENQPEAQPQPPETNVQSRLRIPIPYSDASSSMRNFREKYPSTRTRFGREPTVVGIIATATTEVEFLVADERAHTEDVFMTCIALMNTPDLPASGLCGYYASAICLVFPGMKDLVKQVLKNNGYNPVEVNLPSQAPASAIDMATNSTFKKYLIHVGQLCIVPIKNVSEVNYTQYITKRITELKAKVGVPTGDEELQTFSTVRAALEIKSTFGESVEFKQYLLYRIMNFASTSGVVGSIFSFVSEILAWTDMGALTSILDMLVSVSSPILGDPSVTSEVTNLVDAFKLINRFPHPQFFAILAPANDQRKLERSKFPILISVAQKLKMTQYPSAGQFIPTFNVDSNTVERLVGVHNQHFQRVET